ncbi:MAG: alcohol dehydrogenase catalytic domain-containing protein [Bdellovibrionales bacterium]|nr:alcohol dehydrogenase catalytic domain-containing protein [Bdellovibrionales bacterium]
MVGPEKDVLVLEELGVPEPGPGEVRISVSVCGVCHTELDEIEGRTPPPRLPIIPGHQVVGHVEKCGVGVTNFRGGERVGVGWIHSSDGSELENLSDAFKATGRDANGGYAEYMVVPERYAYPIPEVFSDQQAAPLLCGGSVGYRALKLCNLQDGEPLGLVGFGGSNHLVLQTARYLYPSSAIYVFARSPESRALAVELGAQWVGSLEERPPRPPRAIIDTTPAWLPVRQALRVLAPGGRLVINAIRKEDDDRQTLQELSYEKELWLEKEIKTVANVTSHDVREFLGIAAAVPLAPVVQCYPLVEANTALADLKHGGGRGSKVLLIS